MPGIFGIVHRSGGLDERAAAEQRDALRRMAAAMRYDAEYVCDLFDCPDLGIGVGRVGWASLGSADRRDGDARRPAPARTIVVTAGEPLCEVDITAEAGDPGLRYSGAGARAIGCGYARRGHYVIALLHGTFAGFLLDRHQRRAWLFTDPYGIERLFVLEREGQTLFASEAKALLAVAPEARAYDPEALAEFLACGCTLGTQSLFRRIRILEGGSLLQFVHGHDVQQRRYIDAATLEAVPATPERPFREELGTRLRAAVHRASRRGPRVAVSLTGGLDSRIVMAGLDAAPDAVPCYTFGSMYRDTFDVSVARHVAALCGQPHTVLTLDREFLRELPGLLDSTVCISDGYIGVSGAAELYLNRLARTIAPVRMTGNWGGELLRAVRAFKHRVPRGSFLHPGLVALVETAGAKFARDAASHPLSYTLFHQAPHQSYGRYAIERSQVITRTPFLDLDVVRCLYHAPSPADPDARSAALVRQLRPDLLGIPTDQGLMGPGGMRRAGRRGVRWVTAKAEYWTGPGAPQWLPRLTEYRGWSPVEPLFRGRHKFQHFHRWFRCELAAFVATTIMDAHGCLREWFDMRAVESMIRDHTTGRGNYTDELDLLLTVAVTSRRLLASPPAPPRHDDGDRVVRRALDPIPS
jgi:asparagine synthase (glutamine-hydrolysing)